MSFSADKVPILKVGAGHGQRRFSSSKEPSGNGECGTWVVLLVGCSGGAQELATSMLIDIEG